MSTEASKSGRVPISLVIGALGVVFGDIGTSPLYAIRECFGIHSYLPLERDALMGVASLIFWVLVLVITVKYLSFVMKAHNKGEGGVLALTALINRKIKTRPASSHLMPFVAMVGIFGSALLYADGIITPAISVLSAVEGLEIVTDGFAGYIIPVTLVILFILFFIQSYGTSTIGFLFGPLVITWFVSIGVLGLMQILKTPDVLASLNPVYAVNLFLIYGKKAFFSLGSLFLVATGAEALYADMGHFGAKPISRGWFSLVAPCLLLNYLGQTALLIVDEKAISNPFYLLSPQAFLIPLVILATLTSAVASQAVISGAFSLTRQAIQLGYFPRMRIDFTSSKHEGQIYVPAINRWLAIGTLILVLVFKNSSNLAAAYGIAVSSTMLFTSVLMLILTLKVWRWKPYYAWPVFIVFALIDLAFLSANSLKIMEGGWFPLLVALVIFTLMTTWYSGRALLGKRLFEKGVPWEKFISLVNEQNISRVPGCAIFMTKSTTLTPIPLIHNLHHNKILHEVIILLSIQTEGVPHVDSEHMLEVSDLGMGIWRAIVKIGFQDEANMSEIISHCALKGIPLTDDLTYFLGRESLIPSSLPGMAIWREKLFAFMSNNAERATSFYKVPSEQVFEVGIQVEL
jgi:KUP system potassium uptake protein